MSALLEMVEIQSGQLAASGRHNEVAFLNCLKQVLEDIRGSPRTLCDAVGYYNQLVNVYLTGQAAYDPMRMISAVERILKCKMMHHLAILSSYVRVNLNTTRIQSPFLVPADSSGTALDIFGVFPEGGAKTYCHELSRIVGIYHSMLTEIFGGLINYMNLYKDFAVEHNDGPLVTDVTVDATTQNINIFLNLLVIYSYYHAMRLNFANIYPEIQNLSAKAKASMAAGVTVRRQHKQIDIFSH